MLKYPLTKEAKRRIASYCIDDVLADEQFVDKVVSFIEKVLNTGKIDNNELNQVNVEDFLLMLYSSLIIVSMLPQRVWTRYADALSKYISSNLNSEMDRDCVLYVCKEHGVPALRVSEIDVNEKLKYLYDVAVPVWDYVKFMPKNDPNWKLINRYVVKGYVLLRYNDLIRLVEEAAEKKILEVLSHLKENIIIGKKIQSYLENKLSNLIKRYSRTCYSPMSSHTSYEGKYPPCIESILNEIRNGGNPSHAARFTLAAFMLRALVEFHGKSIEEAVEEVVNLFRTVADFDERKTRYQVMHIAGLVGGRKFYMPPNCDELISLGLCPVNGACNVKNPLVAYAKSLRKFRFTARAQEQTQDKSKA